MSSISIQKISSQAQLENAFSIRKTVFVEEQHVDAREEYDEFEESSKHYLAIIDGQAVATCRWRKTEKGVKLERFAVLPAFRSSGVGTALVLHCLQEIPADEKYLYLHAQLTAVGLYKKCGFNEEGEQFSEANIQHYKMVLKR